MSDMKVLLKKVNCKDERHCTSKKYHCATCLRNKSNIYEDKFSLKKEGYISSSVWDINSIT